MAGSAELQARLPQWPAAAIADYLSGARLAPWEFVADIHDVAAYAYRWTPALRAGSGQSLLAEWTPAHAAAGRLGARARARRLVLAMAAATVVALAVAAGAVIGLKGGPAPVAAWRTRLGGPIDTALAVANGKVYVASKDHYLYALDAATGRHLWRVNIGAQKDSSPAGCSRPAAPLIQARSW